MKITDTSQVIGILTRQDLLCASGGCNVCERTGQPIMRLHPGTLHKRPGANALLKRLDQLRHGYVYVVLDRQKWQAYEVILEGALRQFLPYQPPCVAPPSLSQRCVVADHDIPAACQIGLILLVARNFT